MLVQTGIFFENERQIFIGTVVPPLLIVLTSLRFIPGYLALSGLWLTGLVSHHHHTGRLNPIKVDAPDVAAAFIFVCMLACCTGFIGAETGAGLKKLMVTRSLLFPKSYSIL
ncbi:hypothetical protein ASE92_16035 [Pedobacter sp. Leaf41]|uniref:hypothetical protein n=1 Tax=Pedobacter sp. Leaf41 TaxID=1736218 RepID=UPI000702F49F|nr:hypothetical protein [Pedobacter sp. Leaf41]KQN33309.1 hypothetical protein ASE92_16035 [Pedobacter sp. Leaf41]